MKLLAGALILLAACGSDGPSHGTNVDGGSDGSWTADAAPDGPVLPGGTVAITLHSVHGLTYTAPLTLGGSQHQDVIVDTGSSSLGVASSSCTTCGVSPLYMPGASAVDQHMTAMSTFGDQTGWSGEVYQDSIQLGGAASVAVKFAAITSSSGFFRSLDGGPIPYQGIMGLGPDALLVNGTSSYVTTAIGAGMAPVMGFRLCPDTGTMWLGGVDPAAQAMTPVTTPMVGGFPFYSVNVSDIAVGTQSLGVMQSGFGPTIIDTGTSISFIPTAALDAMSSAISGSPGYAAVFGSQELNSDTCMTTSMTAAQIDSMMPPLHVTFAGAQSAPDLPATRSYLLSVGGNTWCFAFDDSTKIFGGQITASLYGDSLLTAYTTGFDIGNHQMTFAPVAGCAQSPASSLAAQPAPHYAPGIPWWQQDPRVHVPSPAEMQHRLAAH